MKSFQILILKLVTIHVGGNNTETVLVSGNNAKTGVCFHVLCETAPINPLENLYNNEIFSNCSHKILCFLQK